MAAVSLFWDTNMAAVTSCENTLYTNLVQKLKELVNLSSLFKFQLFPINTGSIQNLPNYWVAKTLMSSHILCKVWDFFKRISLKLLRTSGSNFQRQLILLCPFNIRGFYFISFIR